MITGSRMGASFIVLFIGFIYVLRGRNRTTSLSMGLTSLTVTWTTYLAGLVIGVAILQTGVLDGVQLQSGAVLNSVLDRVFDPIDVSAGRWCDDDFHVGQRIAGHSRAAEQPRLHSS